MTLTRRDLMRDGLRLTAFVPGLSALRAVAPPLPSRDERVLVVLQLTGGNDGLNTVVPRQQDLYWRLRPTLGIARSALHDLDGAHGLHPSMGALAETFRTGELLILLGIGSPNPDRSHFRALEMWHTADPFGPPAASGWLGRLAEQLAAGDPHATPALAIGAGSLPLSMRAEGWIPPTLEDAHGLREHERARELAPWRDRLLEPKAEGDLGFLRRAARSTSEAAARIAALVERSGPSSYPDHELARQLELVATLVAGHFGTRIFHLTLTGFDTHARQAPVHAALLKQLSESLAAFQLDLVARQVAERVVLLAFSEFGRRAEENGSRGTDHGLGAPAFLMGSRVRPGFLGTPPDLARLVEGDVPQSTDFRALYAALERDWMGLAPSSSLEPLAVFRDS